MSKAQQAIEELIKRKELEMIRYVNSNRDVFGPYLELGDELMELKDQKHRIMMNRVDDIMKPHKRKKP